jgi:hypothetical protein
MAAPRARSIVLSAAFIGGLALGGCTTTAPTATTLCSAAEIARGCAVVTELFLGLSRPDGGVIGEGEWRTFLADVATPLFPEGFTVLAGEGQWRQRATGRIAREPSHVLVIVHSDPGDDDRLTALIDAYKKSFLQDSVLRVDTKAIARF